MAMPFVQWLKQKPQNQFDSSLSVSPHSYVSCIVSSTFKIPSQPLLTISSAAAVSQAPVISDQASSSKIPTVAPCFCPGPSVQWSWVKPEGSFKSVRADVSSLQWAFRIKVRDSQWREAHTWSMTLCSPLLPCRPLWSCLPSLLLSLTQIQLPRPLLFLILIRPLLPLWPLQ